MYNVQPSVISISIFNILQFTTEIQSHFLVNLVTGLGSSSLLCIIGSKMLVNLKEVGRNGIGDDMSFDSLDISMMEFS